MAIYIPPDDVLSVCTCTRCGRFIVPDQFSSFGSPWYIEDRQWRMGSGTCEDCYGKSVFDIDALCPRGYPPSVERAAEIIKRYYPIAK